MFDVSELLIWLLHLQLSVPMT